LRENKTYDKTDKEPKIQEWLGTLAVRLIQMGFCLDREDAVGMRPGERENASVLVFLPGYADIEWFESALYEAGAEENK
jgi:hypothetical protein